MATPVAGKTAAGNLPTWVIPNGITEPQESSAPYTAELGIIEGVGTTAIQVDCYMDFGDASLTITPQTRERQRMCQSIVQTIQTGETVELILGGVYDQQATSGTVNDMYDELEPGATVYVARAYGLDTDTAPTSASKIDLFKGEVQSRTKTEPAGADEDLKFTSTISVSDYWFDVTLSAV